MEKNISVLIFVESRYKVNRKKIRAAISGMLEKERITTSVEISVAIVGERKMKELSKKYKGDNKLRNVLSFPLSEGMSSNPPGDKLRLGDIVISYPKVIEEAARDEVLVDDKVNELIIHGMGHLLGLHHG